MAKTVIINNITYTAVPSVEIPLATPPGNAVFYETSGATAVAADVLATKTFYGASGAGTGGMTDNGAASGSIATKNGAYTIAQGYHNGGGSVVLDATEKAKLQSGNIKSGISLFGVNGSSSVVDTSDATATSAQILAGYSGYVNGTKIDGSLTAAVVSQDAGTKVVTIS